MDIEMILIWMMGSVNFDHREDEMQLDWLVMVGGAV